MIFLIASFTAGVLFSAKSIDLWLTPFGWANLVLADVLLSWFLADAFFPRRLIYNLFGAEEEPLIPEVRFWRRVVLLACSVLTAVNAMATLASTAGGLEAIPAAVQPPIAALTAAFLAGLGWMYTAFEKEKTDRANNTLAAIREQMYGDHIAKVYRQMRSLSDFNRKFFKIPDDEPLPVDAMETRLDMLDESARPEGKGATTLADAADQFFNALDQLAFGVRQGQFDFRTIEMVLRSRFVRTAFRFSEYLEKETSAEFDSGTGRYRATKRTWEHYLWLVAKLEVLESDNLDPKRIVMPPHHIVGSRASEHVNAAPSR